MLLPRSPRSLGAITLGALAAASLVIACGSTDDGAPLAAGDAASDVARDAAADADAAPDTQSADVTLFPKDDGGPVDVGPPPACTAGFGPSPACGSADKLTWACTNASGCSYECSGTTAAAGAIACSGSVDLVVGAAGERCTIRATGPGGSTAAAANAACAGAPACSATMGGCGETSTISWSCADATSCSYACSGTASAGGAIACSGSTPFAVGAAGETCTITGTGVGGTGAATVVATCLPPRCTGSFDGCGPTSSVTWDCKDATACTFDCTGSAAGSGSLPCSGTTPFAIGAAGETCTISATGPGGSGSVTAKAPCP